MIKLSKPQEDFLFATERDVLFSAGYGSGKTTALCHKALRKLLQDTSCLGILASNFYRSLHTILLKQFTEILKINGFDYVYGKRPQWYSSPYDNHDGILSLKVGGQLLCVSMDNPANFDGISAGFAAADETKDTDKGAFDILQARLRQKHATGTQMFISSIPDGTEQFLYDYFICKGRRVIYSSTYDNEHNLSSGYIQNLKEQYDEKILEEKLYGKFISKNNGNVYYCFEDSNIKDIALRENVPCHCGMDFNVETMMAEVFQYIDNDTVAVVDEIALHNSNTFEMAIEIKKRYPNHFKQGNIYIYPDASGANRASNAQQTDFEILRNAGLSVNSFSCNPPVRDRINVVNSKLKSGSGKTTLFVNPKCKKLIEDFRKVKYNHKGDVDKSDKDRTHAVDAAGYFIMNKFPRIKI